MTKSSMINVQGRIAKIQAQIGTTKLMVVTKKRSPGDSREVMAAGVKFIGENTIQEIERKYDLSLCRELKKNGVELHFIGHLQKNKVNKVLRYCDAIQSVDSIELAEKINAAAGNVGKIMQIFLELNLTGEPQKYGFKEIEIAAAVASIKSLAHVRLMGFMTIGKHGDFETTRQVFRRCRAFADQYELPEVSMGMSEDYFIAYEEGASMVRIGSAVFL